RVVQLFEANGRLCPAEGLPSPPQTRKVTDLKPHPDNHRIYGDTADAELIESIRSKGVLEPLLITLDNLIVSGHRRWRAAQAAGLADVPVIVFPAADDLAVLEALVESNRQRVKTNEQLGREGRALLEVEKERARRRQGARNDLQERVPASDQGQ